MRCEIGRLSQRETSPSPGLPVARTISQDESARGSGSASPSARSRPRPSRAAARCRRRVAGEARRRRRSGARSRAAPCVGKPAHGARRRGDAGDAPVRGRGRGEGGDPRPRIFRFPSSGSLPQGTVRTALFTRKEAGSWQRRSPPTSGRPRPPARAAGSAQPLSSIIRSPRGWRGCCVPTGISPNLVSVGERALPARRRPGRSSCWPRLAELRLVGLRLHAALARDRRRRRRSRADDRARPRPPASWSTASATISATSVMYFAFAFLARRHDGRLGLGAGVARGRQPRPPDQPCGNPAAALSWRVYGKPWLGMPRKAATPCSAGKAGSAAISASGRSAISGCRSAWPARPARSTRRSRKPAPEESARIRAIVRRHAGLSLLLEKALGGNPKTFVIAASVALGGPWLYFMTTLIAAQPHPAGLDPPPQEDGAPDRGRDQGRLSLSSRKAGICPRPRIPGQRSATAPAPRRRAARQVPHRRAAGRAPRRRRPGRRAGPAGHFSPSTSSSAVSGARGARIGLPAAR